MFLVVQCPDCGQCQVTQGKALHCKYCRKSHVLVGKQGVAKVLVKARCESGSEAAAIVRGLNRP
ncbi:hypothetical protein J4207_00970 [Candidatus Woesearchaeota archaeon]|nr:hypothetical protein [Candidatus Woesearchaeota archaeon]